MIPYAYTDSNWRDKLTAYNNEEIHYDAIGNPIDDGIWTYSWAAGRQLRQMDSEGMCMQYTYDHNGMRVKKVAQGDWYRGLAVHTN